LYFASASLNFALKAARAEEAFAKTPSKPRGAREAFSEDIALESCANLNFAVFKAEEAAAPGDTGAGPGAGAAAADTVNVFENVSPPPETTIVYVPVGLSLAKPIESVALPSEPAVTCFKAMSWPPGPLTSTP
jgi:hypothetical protein